MALGVIGLMNVQFALKDGEIYVLEVNPRASRTVPFVAKVIGAPIAKIAARVMAGEKLSAFALPDAKPTHVGVKEAVFPFARFPGVDTVLGPEMRSTGEVIGLDLSFNAAFVKSQLGGALKPLKKASSSSLSATLINPGLSPPKTARQHRVFNRCNRRHCALSFRTRH